MKTVVVQSHAPEKITPWIEECLASVKAWADHIGAEHRFYGDALFELVPDPIFKKFENQKVVLTDYARLRLMQQLMKNGFDRAIWLDADALVLDKQAFVPVKTPYAVGLECWAMKIDGAIKGRYQVHNAFLMSTKEDSFLPFYADTALIKLDRAVLPVPSVHIGPNLLTHIHKRVVNLYLQKSAGMLSPLTMQDIIDGGGVALERTIKGHKVPITCVNLAASQIGVENDGVCLTESDMEKVVETLQRDGLPTY